MPPVVTKHLKQDFIFATPCFTYDMDFGSGMLQQSDAITGKQFHTSISTLSIAKLVD